MNFRAFIKHGLKISFRSSHETRHCESVNSGEKSHEEEKAYNQVVVDNQRKRKKKMVRKGKTDEKSERFSSSQSTKSPPRDDEENVNPQKRKGTIWKILFPDKKFKDVDCELERYVCAQVETKISQDPKVLKIYNDLQAFEESEESKKMLKDLYTKQKNRMSAQLSRERREAILHSLINVCIENIKAKKEMDKDIVEVKQVLKDTL